jgi:hypothetical protein
MISLEDEGEKKTYHGVMANFLYIVFNYLSKQEWDRAKEMSLFAYVMAWKLQGKKEAPDVKGFMALNTPADYLSKLGETYYEGGFTPKEADSFSSLAAKFSKKR